MTRRSFRSWLWVHRKDNTPWGDLAREHFRDEAWDCFTGSLTPNRIRQHVLDVHFYAFTDDRFEAALRSATKAWKEGRL